MPPDRCAFHRLLSLVDIQTRDCMSGILAGQICPSCLNQVTLMCAKGCGIGPELPPPAATLNGDLSYQSALLPGSRQVYNHMIRLNVQVPGDDFN